MVVALCLSLYQLYTAGIAALTALVQRSIHLGAILTLTFLLKPAFKGARKDRFNFWVVLDWLLVAAPSTARSTSATTSRPFSNARATG